MPKQRGKKRKWRKIKKTRKKKKKEEKTMGVPQAMEALSERAAAIRESLQKSQTSTENMVAILGSFDHRLSALETAMRPTQVNYHFLYSSLFDSRESKRKKTYIAKTKGMWKRKASIFMVCDGFVCKLLESDEENGFFRFALFINAFAQWDLRDDALIESV